MEEEKRIKLREQIRKDGLPTDIRIAEVLELIASRLADIAEVIQEKTIR